MPFIPLNLNDAKEQKPVPNGKYDLTITACDETTTKEKGLPQFKVSISIDGHDDAPNVSHYQSIPSADEEKAKMEFKMLLLSRFCTLFKIPIDPAGFDTSDLAMAMVGSTARAELQLSEPDANGNVYSRLVLPRLKDEESRKAAPKPPGRKSA